MQDLSKYDIQEVKKWKPATINGMRGKKILLEKLERGLDGKAAD